MLWLSLQLFLRRFHIFTFFFFCSIEMVPLAPFKKAVWCMCLMATAYSTTGFDCSLSITKHQHVRTPLLSSSFEWYFFFKHKIKQSPRFNVVTPKAKYEVVDISLPPYVFNTSENSIAINDETHECFSAAEYAYTTPIFPDYLVQNCPVPENYLECDECGGKKEDEIRFICIGVRFTSSRYLSSPNMYTTSWGGCIKTVDAGSWR